MQGALGKHVEQIRHGQPGDNAGRDQIGHQAHYQPVALPRPLLHFAKRDVEAARCDSAEKVEKHTEKRVGSHRINTFSVVIWAAFDA